jgi:pimeloyl-ACP methyl ester carboxylesterase
MTQIPKYGAIDVDIDVDEEDQTNNDNSNSSNNNKTMLTAISAALIMMAFFLIMSHGSFRSGSSSSMMIIPEDDGDGNTALFYNDALVDHTDKSPSSNNNATWSHRYYKSMKYFKGPGSPIFMIVGGEGSLDHGMLYPFVTEFLAKKFGAAVIQPEHRFYGPYQPVPNATVDQLLKLLTPAQAMDDMIRLVTHHLRPRDFRDCSPDRSSPTYCPFITIGASYPGFLSAMFRLLHSDVVDAAYASSAPLYMYAQQTDPNIFYDIVTAAAERASPGCVHSVKNTLLDVLDEINQAKTLKQAAAGAGVCPSSIPDDVTTRKMLGSTLVQLASFSFADHDMECYPPGPETGLYKICQLFQDPTLDGLETMKSFFDSVLLQQMEDEKGCDMVGVTCDADADMKAIRDAGRGCFDLGGGDDESGDDAAPDAQDVTPAFDDGRMWEFQTCTNVIFLAGFSETSMFPAYNASYKDLTKECHQTFGTSVTPRPHEMVDMWGFDDLIKQGASRILFTNGLQDMWSGGGILEDLSDSLLAITFENGAHHSDLTHEGPTDKDTDDIKEGFVLITDILGRWLDEIREEGKRAN